MIGSLIGTIFGGVKASEAMEKVRSDLQGQRSSNQAWYERRYNEDVTQRADARRILTKTMEALRDRNREAAGSNAVSGGTEERMAGTRKASADAMADAASRIAVAGENRKDGIEERYMKRDAQLDGQLNEMEVNRANAIAQAAKGLSAIDSAISEFL